MKNHIYINGKLVPENKAVVSVFDRGFLYGDGLFETLRAYNAKPAYLKEHLERLKKGADEIKIPQKLLKKFFEDMRNNAIEKLLQKNILKDAYLRITLTRGVDKAGHLPTAGIKPFAVIVAKPLDLRLMKRLQTLGVEAVIMEDYSPALPHLKTLNYLPNVLAKMEAKKRGAYEGIFIDKDGYIKEGTSTNIFIVSGGAVKTPPVWSGALPGITRGAIIQILRNNGFRVEEERIPTRGLYSCDEAFLTNSIIEVVPLAGVDSKRIGDGRRGPLTEVAQILYRASLSL